MPTITGQIAPPDTIIDTSFKAQADDAISVVLREIKHCLDLHEVSVCTNAIMAIREVQYRQENDSGIPGRPACAMPVAS
jgi:hypothetical protein